jgi:hypothetical protein
MTRAKGGTYITPGEAAVVQEVLRKFRAMKSHSRYVNGSWTAMKAFLEEAGHWKGAPRGRPDISRCRKAGASIGATQGLDALLARLKAKGDHAPRVVQKTLSPPANKTIFRNRQ